MTRTKDVCEIECFNAKTVKKLNSRMPSEKILEKAEGLFSVLAEKSRLKILHAMQEGRELCVCDVAVLLDVSIACASHHLRKMRDLGVLCNRSEGKLVYYSIKNTVIEKLLQMALHQL